MCRHRENLFVVCSQLCHLLSKTKYKEKKKLILIREDVPTQTTNLLFTCKLINFHIRFITCKAVGANFHTSISPWKDLFRGCCSKVVIYCLNDCDGLIAKKTIHKKNVYKKTEGGFGS